MAENQKAEKYILLRKAEYYKDEFSKDRIQAHVISKDLKAHKAERLMRLQT